MNKRKATRYIFRIKFVYSYINKGENLLFEEPLSKKDDYKEFESIIDDTVEWADIYDKAAEKTIKKLK